MRGPAEVTEGLGEEAGGGRGRHVFELRLFGGVARTWRGGLRVVIW